jgi:hypothetical protein
MAIGCRCFTQELRIQIPTLKRVPESAIELFLELTSGSRLRTKGERTDACVRPGTCSWWEWIGGVV